VSAPGSLPLAHAGHVLVDLLMVAPVLVLIVWFVIVTIRDRRRGDPNQQPTAQAPPDEGG
jgi:hypothetical protein